MKRYALVSLHSTTAEQVDRYLPGNYKRCAVVMLHDGNMLSGDYPGTYAVIEGRDSAGWTMDDYVIPRLQSGLIGVREIDLSHPVMKEIPEPVLKQNDRNVNV